MSSTVFLSSGIAAVFYILGRLIQEWAVRRKIRGLSAYTLGVATVLPPFGCIIAVFAHPGGLQSLNVYIVLAGALVTLLFGLAIGWEIIQRGDVFEMEADQSPSNK